MLRSSSRIRRLAEKAKDSQEQASRFHSTRAQLCINFVNNCEDIFASSRQKELRGLLDMNVFEQVPLSSVPQGTRIFDSHFVDEMKMPGTAQVYPKSRLVVQAFKDDGKLQVPTQSPTLDKDTLLKVVKFLYGVPEADMQADDTLTSATDRFAAIEQKAITNASNILKPVQKLTIDNPLMFNGAVLKRKIDHYTNGLSLKKQYVAHRAWGAYIASVCQPEANFDYSIAAQMNNDVFLHKIQIDRINMLNKWIKWQLDSPNRDLTLKSANLDSVKLVHTNAFHANNRDMSSQIGYAIVIVDNNNTVNLLHWSSFKYKRIILFFLASELYAMVHGFDMGIAIKTTICAILGRQIPMYLYTDSHSLYECISKLGTTQKKKLMIDILCLRESYERKEITELRWIATQIQLTR
ncbi:hypothetical protein EV44_g3468 [Erysiphe necator]|uniref:Integrase catalytic domain-containing protein n=1 Tax=Uncinula necator TaxID=52586 RepID=A0A0B1PC35_UNCNE|nr:hypothetical protein EV44_g3468 [Erysiphe necator]